MAFDYICAYASLGGTHVPGVKEFRIHGRGVKAFSELVAECKKACGITITIWRLDSRVFNFFELVRFRLHLHLLFIPAQHINFGDSHFPHKNPLRIEMGSRQSIFLEFPGPRVSAETLQKPGVS